MTQPAPQEEQVFVLLDANGEVFNAIVADQAFIDALPGMVKDPDVQTAPELDKLARALDVTGMKEDRPGIGWKRAKDGKWNKPTPPPAPPVDPAPVDPTPKPPAKP